VTISQVLRMLMVILCIIYMTVDGRFSFANAAENSAIGGQGIMGAAEEDSTVGTFMHRLICLVLIFLVVPYLKQLFQTFGKLKVIALLAILPALSIAWSQNPVTTLKDSIYLFFTMFFAIYLADCVPPERQMRAFWVTGVIVALSSIAFAVALPRFGIDHRTGRGNEWEGIFAGKNNCAASMFFLLMPVLLMRVRGALFKAAQIFSGLLILFLIIMTRSRTTWLITASFLVFLIALKFLGRFKRGDVVAMAPVALGAAVVLAGALYLNLKSVVQLLGRDLTFSGRTKIWSALMISIAKHPLLGYGYRAFWQGMTGESANVISMIGWDTGYAHNGFLEVAVQLGAVGLLLFALSFIKACRDAVTCFYAGRPAYIDWYICILFYTVFYNITEASIMTRFDLIWLLYVMSCVALHHAAQQRRQVLQQSRVPVPAAVLEHAGA
jgi:exopolysaccharide production protein ExoQ